MPDNSTPARFYEAGQYPPEQSVGYLLNKVLSSILSQADSRLAAYKLTYAQWKAVVDTNLTGMFLCTREAFRTMKAQVPQGGRIIHNGSISAQVPRPGSVAYAATKHEITGLTRTAALDGRAWNIAVGQIDIGNAASDMTAAMTAGIRQADGSLKVEPVMDVQHAADAVLQMAALPLSANVLQMTVMASAMPFVGRG